VKETALARGRIHVRVPPGWQDITHQVGGDEAPFSLAKGEGALQLSVGVQRSGPGKPQPTPQDLLQMGREIAAQRGLRAALDQRAEMAPRLMGTLSYHEEDAFIRLWVVFDGAEFVAASYVCAYDARDAEQHEAELIVRSVLLK